MFGIYLTDKTGKYLVGRVLGESEAERIVAHMDDLQNHIYELMGRANYEESYGELKYTIEELECSICHKKHVPVKDYEVVDCKEHHTHSKNICSDCRDKIDENAYVWEE